jgi:hypothetical protein
MASLTTAQSSYRLQTNTTALVKGGSESTECIFNIVTTFGATTRIGFQNAWTIKASTDDVWIYISGTTYPE